MTITPKRRFGDIGENVAVEFLTKHGFAILDRNYLRKWGELDIVARKGSKIHFVEVKSAKLYPGSLERGSQVSHETPNRGVTHEPDRYRPEENVHPQKLKRLARTMQTYLLEKRLDDLDWQLDIITVHIDEESRRARVELLENIII